MKKPYQLRLDEEMINQVKESAELNDRSVNAEFRSLIRKSLENTSNCGIYKITNPEGFFYIGKTQNISNRFINHIEKSSNPKLKESFEKFTINDHVFEILEECKIEDLTYREKYFLDKHSGNNLLLNINFSTGKRQNRIEVDYLNLHRIKEIAKVNNRPYKTMQNLIDLMSEISVKCIENLDQESFENVTNLKL